MIDREWWVQVNLDDLAHVTAQMETTEERGQWLEGFMVGAQGHSARDSWDGFKRVGFDFGAACHAEAAAFRASKSAAGKASAESRRAKYGSASPNTVRTLIEHTSEREAEQATEQTPNQPTTNNQQPTTNNEKRTTKSFSAETEEIYKAYPKRVERPDALKEIEIALKIVAFDDLLSAVKEYAKAVSGWPKEEIQFVPSCGRWMKKQRWLDDRETWIKKPKQAKNGVQHNGFFETDYSAGLDSVPSY